MTHNHILLKFSLVSFDNKYKRCANNHPLREKKPPKHQLLKKYLGKSYGLDIHR